MKDSIAKLLPIAVGLAIGWLLFDPPALLAPLGALSYLVMFGLGFVLLVAFIAYLISANLPKDIQLTYEAGPVSADLQVVVDRLLALGFRAVGPAYKVELSPPAVMVALVHPGEPVYATVFRTGTIPAVTEFDFVSILDGYRGGLTTMSSWRGGTLPAGAQGLRQIFPDANAEQLFRHHGEGIAYLRSRGLCCKPVAADSFTVDFKKSFARQRQGFLSAPLRYALISLYRSTFRKVPHIGPLQQQPYAEQQIRALTSGLSKPGEN